MEGRMGETARVMSGVTQRDGGSQCTHGCCLKTRRQQGGYDNQLTRVGSRGQKKEPQMMHAPWSRGCKLSSYGPESLEISCCVCDHHIVMVCVDAGSCPAIKSGGFKQLCHCDLRTLET